MIHITPCDCEYCRPFTPQHSTYLHAGAAAVWPANTDQARITRQMLAEAVEAARREGYASGNEAGYEIGYEHGYSYGNDDGFAEGAADGYDEGFEDGVAHWGAGYDAAYADGFYDARNGQLASPASEWIEGWGRVS